LYYNYYRDYSPKLGRYVEPDPIAYLGSISSYGYVSGNPIDNIDSFGLWQEPYTGYNGYNAHRVFFGYIQARYPEMKTDIPLTSIGFPPTMLRPDVLDPASGQIWELKPITHRNPQFWAADDKQVNDYICKTNNEFRLGDPYFLISQSTPVGHIYTPFGDEYQVVAYPGRQGFIYYSLNSTGKNTIRNVVRQFGEGFVRSNPYPDNMFATPPWVRMPAIP
jgi:hypothetical protein